MITVVGDDQIETQPDLNPGVGGSNRFAVTSILRGSSPSEDDDGDHSEMVPTTVMVNDHQEEGDASPLTASVAGSRSSGNTSRSPARTLMTYGRGFRSGEKPQPQGKAVVLPAVAFGEDCRWWLLATVTVSNEERMTNNDDEGDTKW